MTNTLKSQYMRRAVLSGDVRKVWKSIKTVGRSGVPLAAHQSLHLSAEEFSNYFSSVFQGNGSVVESSETSYTEIASFSVFQVFDELRRLRRKSSGPDEIPFWVYRDFSWLLAPAITSLFNRCMKCGKVPDCFKKAKVVHIPKCPQPKSVSDFRPISLLPQLSKVFEKMICNSLILPYVVKSVDPAQFAFFPRPGSGTSSALTLLCNRILSFLDSESGAVRLLSIDFSKAFDKATHDVIYSAMSNFDIPILSLVSSTILSPL